MKKNSSKKIFCLSGWGQKFDSLESIFDPFFVESFDYLKFSNLEDFTHVIAEKKITHEILVGWSLGGQLAIRLVAQKILNPKLLILIAPPFQMIKDSRIQAAMTKETFNKFYQNFIDAPDKTLKQFSILTAMNDRNALQIAKNLNISDKNFIELKFWLEELARFSCFDVDFSNMPQTLYFHGAGDMIVHISQAEYFKQRIKNLHFKTFKNCGHAPHLNNPNLIKKIISTEISKI